MRPVYIIAVMAALGLSVVAMIQSRQDDEHAGTHASALPGSLDAKRPTLRREHGQDTKRPGIAAPARSASPVTDDIEALSAAPAQPLAVEPAEQPVTPEQARDEIENAFIDDVTDAHWARQAERTAQEKLAMAMPEASGLLALECRSSMCRMETLHQDPGDYGQFLQNAFSSPDTQIWNAASFSTPLRPDDSGGMVIVSYLAREGGALPIPGSSRPHEDLGLR